MLAKQAPAPDPLSFVERFIAEIDHAQTLDHIYAALQVQISRMGFDHFAYWLIRPPSGPRIKLFLTNYAQKWVSHYADENYASDDIVGRYAALSLKPFSWSETRARYLLTPRQNDIMSEATSVGLRAGGSIPLHGPRAAKAAFTVCNDMPQEAFDRLFLSVRHELHLMATYAHEKILALGLKAPTKSSLSLTLRETEVLTWMARGKTAWEVGEILSISHETVKKHVDHACLKLNASNKTHAVAKALMEGLILP